VEARPEVHSNRLLSDLSSIDFDFRLLFQDLFWFFLLFLFSTKQLFKALGIRLADISGVRLLFDHLDLDSPIEKQVEILFDQLEGLVNERCLVAHPETGLTPDDQGQVLRSHIKDQLFTAFGQGVYQSVLRQAQFHDTVVYCSVKAWITYTEMLTHLVMIFQGSPRYRQVGFVSVCP